MERVIINKEKLRKEEIDKTKIKSRVILLNDKNEIILCNYNGCYLLIGGKVEKQETIKEALLREIKEEIGVVLDHNDIKEFILIEHYQKNYPTENNTIKNNLLITYYFILDFFVNKLQYRQRHLMDLIEVHLNQIKLRRILKNLLY